MMTLATAMMVWPATMCTARDPRIPVSASFTMPISPTRDSLVDLRAGYGVSVGYLHALNKHVSIGVHGVMEHLPTALPASNALTTFHMLGSVRYRLLAFIASPYLHLEGGVAVQSMNVDDDALERVVGNAGTSMLSAAVRAGMLVPVSSSVDVDAHARYGVTAATTLVSTLSVHAGIVLRLER